MNWWNRIKNGWGRFKGWLRARPAAIRNAMNKIHIPKWITPGRFLAAVYVFAILLIAHGMPDTTREVHATAIRYLGPNTRIAGVLLDSPRDLYVEARMRLDRERRFLIGRYVRHEIEAGAAVAPDNVLPWPNLSGQDATPVGFDTEPDWMHLNQGAAVEVWVADKQIAAHAVVLAIVPSGEQWMALLKKSDLASVPMGTPRDKTVLRVAAMPARPGDLGSGNGKPVEEKAPPPEKAPRKIEKVEKDMAKSKGGRKWDSQPGEKSRR